jgi:hypothetical protein
MRATFAPDQALLEHSLEDVFRPWVGEPAKVIAEAVLASVQPDSFAIKATPVTVGQAGAPLNLELVYPFMSVKELELTLDLDSKVGFQTHAGGAWTFDTEKLQNLIGKVSQLAKDPRALAAQAILAMARFKMDVGGSLTTTGELAAGAKLRYIPIKAHSPYLKRFN